MISCLSCLSVDFRRDNPALSHEWRSLSTSLVLAAFATVAALELPFEWPQCVRHTLHETNLQIRSKLDAPAKAQALNHPRVPLIDRRVPLKPHDISAWPDRL